MYTADGRTARMSLLALLFAALTCCSVDAQTISVNNTSKYEGSGKYRWTLYLEAFPSTLQQVERVEYKLPGSFEGNALRRSVGPRSGKYPFSTSDVSLEPLTIKVTVFFRRGRSPEELPYTLTLSNPIGNPGGVAVTPIIRLKERTQVAISEPPFRGQLTVFVDDIHRSGLPFRLKVINSQTSATIAEGNSGARVHFPFKHNEVKYVLEGYTKIDIARTEYLFFKIYRLTPW